MVFSFEHLSKRDIHLSKKVQVTSILTLFQKKEVRFNLLLTFNAIYKVALPYQQKLFTDTLVDWFTNYQKISLGCFAELFALILHLIRNWVIHLLLHFWNKNFLPSFKISPSVQPLLDFQSTLSGKGRLQLYFPLPKFSFTHGRYTDNLSTAFNLLPR